LSWAASRLPADEGDMHDIVAAVRKVRDHADEL
jgi:hypothetical protein